MNGLTVIAGWITERLLHVVRAMACHDRSRRPSRRCLVEGDMASLEERELMSLTSIAVFISNHIYDIYKFKNTVQSSSTNIRAFTFALLISTEVERLPPEVLPDYYYKAEANIDRRPGLDWHDKMELKQITYLRLADMESKNPDKLKNINMNLFVNDSLKALRRTNRYVSRLRDDDVTESSTESVPPEVESRIELICRTAPKDVSVVVANTAMKEAVRQTEVACHDYALSCVSVFDQYSPEVAAEARRLVEDPNKNRNNQSQASGRATRRIRVLNVNH